MEKIANSWWMYLLGGIVVTFVLAGSLFYIIRSFKEAKQIGMDKAVLKKTIINSIVFTILPSISILIGVIALSGILGIPLPWIRLSVIGALHYEGIAAQSAYPGQSLTLELLTQKQFITIAFVMTLGILSGPLFCLFGFKAYDKKVIAKAKQASEMVVDNLPDAVDKEALERSKDIHENIVSGDEIDILKPNEAKPKKSFGDVLFNAVFIAMICSFLAPEIAKLKKIGELGNEAIDKATNVKYIIGPIHTYLPLIVICVTFLCMFICDILEKKCKQKWLASFDLGLSMLIGMAVAVFLG